MVRVYRSLSSQEQVCVAYWYFNDVYSRINPIGTVYFWSILARLNKNGGL